jgi:hypothetical protein
MGMTASSGTTARAGLRHVERAVAAILILGVAASPIPYLPLSVFGWLAILPVVLFPALRSITARLVVALLAAAGVFQLIVDLTLAVPLEDLAKGAARYGGLLLPLLGCLWAIERRLLDRHEVAFLHGLGWLVGVVVFFDPASPDYGLWKFGLLSPVSLMVVALISRMWTRTRRLSWLLALVPVAALALLTGTRSTAIQVGLAALLSIVVLRTSSPRSMLRTATAITAFVLMFSAAANAGLLGETVREKWQEQGGTPISTLIVGRPESSFSVGALVEEGFVPHGSESPATARAYTAGAAGVTALAEPEKNAMLDRITSRGLDLHSVVATAAWQGGIVCGLAFALICVMVLCRIIGLRRWQVTALGPLYVYSGLVILWDFLFSPWTYFTGTAWGVLLAVVFASQPVARSPEPRVE